MIHLLSEPVQRCVEHHGFTFDPMDERWTFTGHPSQGTTITLSIDDADQYVLSIGTYAGGEGYEDECAFAREQDSALVATIEEWCDAALEPVVKTRLQRFFERWIGHDAAWAFFHRKPPRQVSKAAVRRP